MEIAGEPLPNFQVRSYKNMLHVYYKNGTNYVFHSIACPCGEGFYEPGSDLLDQNAHRKG